MSRRDQNKKVDALSKQGPHKQRASLRRYTKVPSQNACMTSIMVIHRFTQVRGNKSVEIALFVVITGIHKAAHVSLKIALKAFEYLSLFFSKYSFNNCHVLLRKSFTWLASTIGSLQTMIEILIVHFLLYIRKGQLAGASYSASLRRQRLPCPLWRELAYEHIHYTLRNGVILRNGPSQLQRSTICGLNFILRLHRACRYELPPFIPQYTLEVAAMCQQSFGQLPLECRIEGPTCHVMRDISSQMAVTYHTLGVMELDGTVYLEEIPTMAYLVCHCGFFAEYQVMRRVGSYYDKIENFRSYKRTLPYCNFQSSHSYFFTDALAIRFDVTATDTDSCRICGLCESDSIWTCRVTVYFLVGKQSMVRSQVRIESVSRLPSFIVFPRGISLELVQAFLVIIRSSIGHDFFCFDPSVTFLHHILVSSWESIFRIPSNESSSAFSFLLLDAMYSVICLRKLLLLAKMGSELFLQVFIIENASCLLTVPPYPGRIFIGCVPRSLSWRVSLSREGERGFRLDQVLTFALVSSKTYCEGCRFRVASSHTSNHRKDDFTPLETIRMFLGIIGSKSLSSSKGRPSSRRGGYVINKVLDNVVVEGIDKEASSSDPVSSIAGFDFGNPKSDEDEVLDPGDEMASYMSSSGGGFQLEDDFYNGYEAQDYLLSLEI
ncbi:hypothetical protein Tco_0992135 [Tanacetum coccineum]|uniref:Uncharacterized protein n=1 Tax=Tanacetum coccineum TaxID=301880 RepID=A0ABQ5F174_9ASTR